MGDKQDKGSVILRIGHVDRAGPWAMSPYWPDDPATVWAFVARVAQRGAVVLTDNQHWPPVNHRVVGVGVGHDDAIWAESRFRAGSRAAYCENDGGFLGRRIAAVEKMERRIERRARTRA